MPIENRSEQHGELFHGWRKRELIGTGSNGRTAVYRLVKKNPGGWTEERALKVVNILCEEGCLAQRTPHAQAEYAAYREALCRKACNEVQLMSRLEDDPFIVGCLAWDICDWEKDGQFGSDLLIQMHLMETLETIQKTKDGLREEEILQLGLDICRALVRCQEEGLVHRDIKPANIFRHFSGRGNYMLGDFGISRIVDNGTAAGTRSAGTAAYAAPEQMEMEVRPDIRMDIYSLGVVLYQLSNRNHLPFADSMYITKESIRRRLIKGEPLPAPSEASPALAGVILKACAFRPEDRFQAAGEFFDALESIKWPARGEKPAPELSEDPYATVPLSMLPTLMEQAEGSGIQAGQEAVKMADSSTLEEGLLFDEQLDRLIANRPAVSAPITPLQRIVEKKLSERYWNHISDHVRPHEKSKRKDAASTDSGGSGKHFTISASPNMKYIGYRVRQNKYHFNTLTTTFSAEILEQAEEFRENGSCDVTFYIDAPDSRNGTFVVLLGIDSQEGNLYISNGILIGDRFLLERDVQIQTFNTSLLLSSGRSATYVSTEEARNYLNDTTLDGTAIIIDLSTCTPVLREIYYGETGKDKKARIPLKHNNAYFVFKLIADKQRNMTDVEIGECYEFAAFGFPRDIMKAVQQYEKAHSKIGYYRIAELFKSDPVIKDEPLAFEYMRKAAEAGCRTAMLDLAEMLRNGTGGPVDETEAEKWQEKGRQLPDDSRELTGPGTDSFFLDGGVLYTD